MKNILIIFFLLNSFFISAQSKKSNNYGKIIYERVLYFDNNPQTTIFSLIFSPNFSIFNENSVEQKEDAILKPISDDEFDLSFNVKFNGSKYIVLTNFKKDSIQSQVSLFKQGKQKTYIVEEKINKIKWSIKNEYKVISDLKAQKAIGEFRGRKYVAWFTKKIPVIFGPWKLNGLPGLILNVSDSKNEVIFNVVSIKIPYYSNSETKEDFKFNSEFKKIPLSEYVQLKKLQVEEVKKLINSKLPRGAMLEMTNNKSNDIELEYEFEEIIKD